MKTGQRKEILFSLIFSTVLFICVSANNVSAAVVTFDELSLSNDGYWNGSDLSGGFTSSGVFFINNYDSQWESWDSFAYSNITSNTEQVQTGQYSAIAGAGHGLSPNYAICYVGWTGNPVLTFEEPNTVYGLYVTNNCSAYESMLNGDMFSKKFGGSDGTDPDWFCLRITGLDSTGAATGTVDFYLADFRFEDSSMDYILAQWKYVDLTSLGEVAALEFNLSSSDTGEWGMNTPAYFALDTIIYQSQSIYNQPYIESGINGYISTTNNHQHAGPDDQDAVLNPIFKAWATNVIDYCQAPDVDLQWSNPAKALGLVTGKVGDVFSLGELTREQIYQGTSPGWITLSFDESISNCKGYDFVVFENAMLSQHTTTTGSADGQILAELAYVEVSSNGENFVRFPSVSLTDKLTGTYGTINQGDVHNLAGKHPNSYNTCIGTAFDLQDIAEEQDVISGLVDINDINYIRIVDIPGTGDFYDSAVQYIDPNSQTFANYSSNHPIFDAWMTWGSGGFDLEAIGVLNEQQYSADIDLNGIVDMDDVTVFMSAYHKYFGQAGWIERCDLAEPKDLYIDELDLEVFLSQWQMQEMWCYQD